MSRLRNPDIDPNIDLDLSFAFNQTFNIFHSKILHVLDLVFNLLYINLIIIFYISALAFFKKEVLRVL